MVASRFKNREIMETRSMMPSNRDPSLLDHLVTDGDIGARMTSWRRTGKLKTPNTLAKTWQGCLDKIGMKERFTVHGLRRTFNDLTRRAGADGIVTRALTGHVTEGMTAHYSTVGLDEKRAAVAGVLNLVPLPKSVDAGVDGGRN